MTSNTAGLSCSEGFLDKGTKKHAIWNAGILLGYQNCQKLKSANYNFKTSQQSLKEGPITMSAKRWYLFM